MANKDDIAKAEFIKDSEKGNVHLTGNYSLATSLKKLYDDLCTARQNRGWDVRRTPIVNGYSYNYPEGSYFNNNSSEDNTLDECSAMMKCILQEINYKSEVGQSPGYAHPFLPIA